jgi:hypothetical protein
MVHRAIAVGAANELLGELLRMLLVEAEQVAELGENVSLALMGE